MRRKGQRTYVLTVAEQDSFDPVRFTAHLKRRGFRFISERCPVQLAKPFTMEKMPDGTVVWTQWEEPAQ